LGFLTLALLIAYHLVVTSTILGALAPGGALVYSLSRRAA